MTTEYIDQRDLNNFRVFLYTPGLTFIGDVITTDESLKLSLTSPYQFNFSVPAFVEGQRYEKLDYLLDNYVIEVVFGDLSDYTKTQIERFVITNTPKSFAAGVTSYNFTAHSTEIKNNRLEIIGWYGVEKLRYNKKTATYTAAENANQRTFNLINFDDRYALTAVQYDRNDNPFTLIEVEDVSEVKEGTYHFDGSTITYIVPSETQDNGDGNPPTQTYYYIFTYSVTSSTDPNAGEEEIWYTPDGLQIDEVMESVIEYADSIWTISLESDFSEDYRSGFQFNNVNLGEAINTILEAFDATPRYDRINNIIYIYKSQDYGEDKDFTIGYGKYLTDISRDENATQISTRIYGLGKDNIGISYANITGEPYYEDYDYYLDGATYHNEGTEENPIWVLDTGSRWMSDSLTLKLSVWQHELVEDEQLNIEYYGQADQDGLVQYANRLESYISKQESIKVEHEAVATVYGTSISVMEGYDEDKMAVYDGIEKAFKGDRYGPGEGEYLRYLRAVRDDALASADVVQDRIDRATNYWCGSSEDPDDPGYPSDFDPSVPIQGADLNNNCYGLNQIYERMDYIAEALKKENLGFTQSDLDELYHYEKDFVYSNSNVEDSYDLYLATKDNTIEERTIKINYSLNTIDILNAGEAKEDWHKLVVGDWVNINVKQINTDIKAQIKEMNINIPSHTMSLMISNITNLKRTNPVEKLSDWFKKSDNKDKNVLDYNESDWNASSDRSEENSEQLDSDIDSSDRNVNAGWNNNGDFTVSLGDNSLVIKNQDIDPTTDDIYIPGGYLPDGIQRAVDTIRISNGGLYILNEDDDEMKISITSLSGFISYSGKTRTVSNANEGFVIKTDKNGDGIYDETEYVLWADTDGNLQVKGDITATKGWFGGWYADDDSGFLAGFDGDNLTSMLSDGVFVAYNDPNSRFSVVKSNGDFAFYAGGSTFSSSNEYDDANAPFRVKHNGDMVANSAVIGGSSSYSGTLNDATGSVLNLEGSANGMTGSMNNMSGSVNGITGSMSNMGGSVNNISGSMNNMSGSVSNISGSMNGMTGTYNGTHNQGVVGGWTIQSTYLYANSGRTVLSNSGVIYVRDSAQTKYSLMKSDGSYAFAAGSSGTGDSSCGSAPFNVTHQGALKSTSATITGSITATSGYIGSSSSGWVISSSYFQSNNGAIRLEASNRRIWVRNSSENRYASMLGGGSNTENAFQAGHTSAGTSTSAPFYVRHDGYFKSTSGQIASWNINSSSLTGSNVGLNSAGQVYVYNSSKYTGMKNSGIALFCGGASATDASGANFQVSGTGVMTATGADIGGTIDSNSGSTLGSSGTGWSITSNEIKNNSYGKLKNTYFLSNYGNSNGFGILSDSENSYFAALDNNQAVGYSNGAFLNLSSGGIRLWMGTLSGMLVSSTTTIGVKVRYGSATETSTVFNGIWGNANGTSVNSKYNAGGSTTVSANGDVNLQAGRSSSINRYCYAQSTDYGSDTKYRITGSETTGPSTNLIKSDIQPISDLDIDDYLELVEIKDYYNEMNEKRAISLIIEDEQLKGIPFQTNLFSRQDRFAGFSTVPTWLQPNENDPVFVTKLTEYTDDLVNASEITYINPLSVDYYSLIGLNTAAAKYNHNRIKTLETQVAAQQIQIDDLIARVTALENP